MSGVVPFLLFFLVYWGFRDLGLEEFPGLGVEGLML